MMNRDWRGVIVVLALVGALAYMAKLEPNAITMMIVGCLCGVLGSALQRHKSDGSTVTGWSLPPPSGNGTTLRVPPLPPPPLDPGTSSKAREVMQNGTIGFQSRNP